MVIFDETTTPGRGNHILVKRIVERELGKPIPVAIGWIGKADDGGFAYYEPETNDIDPKIVGDALDEVKQQVEALYKNVH